MTADISRRSHRPGQRYSGVARQAGRLAVDSDENEADAIEFDALRDLITDTVCAKGTPDNGYQVRNVSLEGDGAFLDFDVSPGTFYLSGMRIESDEANSYRNQSDWLTQALDEPAQPPPPGSVGPRTDLVWIHSWTQTVSAVEDSELLEPALGGPDTTARRRTMHRIEVTPDVSNDCDDAMAEMLGAVFGGATVDEERCSIVSPAELTISFADVGVTEDLCKPSAQAGFLGANNETFRVRITEPGRFVWGRDNASALHRVQVDVDDDGNRRVIRLLTPPRDEHGWPLAGQTVELLRWGALLDNHEKVAENSGLLASVVSDYDPVEQQLTINADVPLEWDNLFSGTGASSLNPRDEEGLNTYFYMRIWTGGGQGASPDIAMAPEVPLGDTGILATFSNDGLADDYWVLAARPNVPTSILPWALLDGAPPHGPDRSIAPLALLQWDGTNPLEPVDCRHRFRPLCRVGGCSLVTVGDGRISHGDVTSIQAAIDLLPAEGGEVCIHPGDFEEHVVIDGRQNVTITGCGRTTRWSDAGENKPLIAVSRSSGITVRRLALSGSAVTAVRTTTSATNVLVEDVGFICSDAPAVLSESDSGMTVRRCRVGLSELSAPLDNDEDTGRLAAMICQGQDITVEGCRIEMPTFVRPTRRPVGGIHIAGDSKRVQIRNNLIRDGNGHGITLGSIQYVVYEADFEPASTTAGSTGGPKKWAPHEASNKLGYRAPLSALTDCPEFSAVPPKAAPNGDDEPAEPVPISRGVIRDLVIEGNRIERVGLSGISAQYFLGLGLEPGQDAFATSPNDGLSLEQVRINDNLILNNMQNSVGQRSSLVDLLTGWGGIALSICSDVVIRDNTIISNGKTVGDPISGVFLAIAEDVRVERNRIEDNGVQAGSTGDDPGGRRGGIAVGLAIGGQSSVSSQDPERAVDRPALVVTDNVVDAPSARALRATVLGPAMVLGNRLVGAGRSQFFTDPFGSIVGVFLTLRNGLDLTASAANAVNALDLARLNFITDVLGGDAVNVVSLGSAEDLNSFARFDPFGVDDVNRLRGGELAFNDNQVSMRAHRPEPTLSVSAVLLTSGDDVSVANNQLEIENDAVFSFLNTLALSPTLRVTANRFQEPIGRTAISALTIGLLNTTADNQSTHCLSVLAPAVGRVDRDNKSYTGIFYPELCGNVSAISETNSRKMKA